MSKKGKSKINERNKAQTKKSSSIANTTSSDPHNAGSQDDPLTNTSSKPPKVRLPTSIQDMNPDWIADISESILENPDAAFSTTMIESEGGGRGKGGGRQQRQQQEHVYASKMRQLLVAAAATSATSKDNDDHENQRRMTNKNTTTDVPRLALLSLLAIFKDILPAYRIRLPTLKEMAVKVSKDTKTLWDYERALLSHYQEYLQILERTWNNKSNSNASSSSTPSPLAVTAAMCLCELLKSAFHFNFRSNLLMAVIRPMNHAVDQVSSACCQAIQYVFANDAQGEVALEAARQVAKMIRDRNFKVRPNVLRTFAALPLRVHLDEAQAAKIAQIANAKKRKRDKETAAIEEEMKESRATTDKIVLARAQSDTLQALTLTYFRILKSENHHERQLLPAALEGLAKFSHLINLDTVLDLLDLLKNLLKDVDSLPLDAALNCVLTAFSTLHGPGKELQVDVKEYILPLYSQIPRFVSESAGIHTDLLLQCLAAAFLKRREFSSTRISAFCKQIWSVCLHAPPATSGPLLAFSRQLLQRYASTSVPQLLENEHDVITSGQYNPNVTDPEHSNPLATSGWELSLLKYHYHAALVAMQATCAANSKLLQLPAEGPERLREQLLEDTQQDLFIPFVRLHKKHPLEPYTDSSKQGDTKQRRVRFVTPRHQECQYI